VIPWLDQGIPFPPVETALAEPNGLLAVGGDLAPERLLAAYRQGIFPWFNAEQPILWWSPDPRMVLFPAELRVSRSLARQLRRRNYEIRFDTAFRDVVLACATVPRAGQDGTWITTDMIEAYCRLHELGFAHSVETWINGQLAGAIYGVAIGHMFYGESMFHKVTNASKLALAHLVRYLDENGFGMMDCQMHTGHLASLGAREIPRSEFSGRLAELVNFPQPSGKWTMTGHDTTD
jgi:leucyl/phenylalanyl-tRNA--protein transferase